MSKIDSQPKTNFTDLSYLQCSGENGCKSPFTCYRVVRILQIFSLAPASILTATTLVKTLDYDIPEPSRLEIWFLV